MKRFLAIGLSVVMALGLLAGCGGSTGGTTEGGAPAEGGKAAETGDTIKIGWIGALTGDSAVFGTAESQTLKMLVEEKNAAGGVLGKQIQLVCYDTRGDVAESVNAVNRLITQDKVCAILGPNASDQAIAIAGVLEKNHVPEIATVATNPKCTVGDDGKVKPYNFRVCFIDPYVGGVAAKYAVEKLGKKKVAVLYDVASDYSQGITQYFLETLEKVGGELVAKEGFKAGDVDFRPQLTKIKESGAELIFMPYFYKEVALSANQARELGITATFMGGDAWQSAELFNMAKDAVQGAYVINHLDFNDPALKPLIDKYTAKYPGNKPELNTFLGNDAFGLLIAAIEKAGSADPQAITDALTQVEYAGVTGNIKIDPETHNPLDKEAVMTKIDGEQYTFVERYSTK